MVPGSTLMYGSSFCIVTRSPRLFSSRPREDAVRPLPRLDATPPVTKMCLAMSPLLRSAPALCCTRPVHRHGLRRVIEGYMLGGRDLADGDDPVTSRVHLPPDGGLRSRSLLQLARSRAALASNSLACFL